MSNELSVFVKKGRRKVRGLMKGVASFAAAAILSYWVWGLGSMVKISVFLAGFFALALLLEYMALRANERELKATALVSEQRPIPKPVVDHDFTLQRLPDEEDEWHVRRIIVGGTPVRIQISDEPGLLDRARPYANALCEEPEGLAARFKAFLSAEAQRNPQFAEEIKRLQLESIAFMFPKQPESAEVCFTEESGGNIFFCSIVNGEFAGFRMES